MKHFVFLLLATWIVFSATAGAVPPYTPSQTTPKVVIETIVGDITIELFPAQAPITVDNFLQYVNSGFYDGLIIHRITKDTTFKIVQGGGYRPGGVLRTEGLRPPIINESYNGLSNLRGTIAMARTSDPNSATSQFYINVTDNQSLDRGYYGPSYYGYCVFGQIIAGMDIVDQIQQLPILPPQYAGGLTECPYYGDYWVYIFRQQVRVCVSPSGNDTTGLGSVDSPLQTIQKGIDVVNEPGHVVLAPATYTGAGNVDLDFKGKAITVRAIEPRDSNTVTRTVIDCQGSSASRHRAFYFNSGEDADSVVQGLTIINGYQILGGAILCNSSPTIKNCTLINNTASIYGGGIYCSNSNAVITNCTFSANTALSKGGAVYCGSYSGVTLQNSILWNNTAVSAYEIALTSSSSPSTIAVSYSDIEGGQAEVYADAGCSAVWGPGNIDMDPRFVDVANNDYHLQSEQGQWQDAVGWTRSEHTSPCIDRGNPGSPVGHESVASSNVRIDMGSFGGTTKSGIPPQGWGLLADIDNDGVTDNADFAWFASYWLAEGSNLPADLDRNQSVEISDLQLFCDDWLGETIALMVDRADFNKDDIANFKDFAVLAGEWQQQGPDKISDLNDDERVDLYDLYWLMKVWLY